MAETKVICPYCDLDAELVDSAEIYNGKSYGMMWLCRQCGAYVGTHNNSPSHKPLGRLANAELREYKKAAHDAFDVLWMRKMQKEKISKSKARRSAYEWLSSQLGISKKNCHIGMMDVATCKRVIDLCLPYAVKTGKVHFYCPVCKAYHTRESHIKDSLFIQVMKNHELVQGSER